MDLCENSCSYWSKKHEAEIKRIPAATKNHHAFKGGYLEHTLSVVRTGAYFADKYIAYYPDLDPPLDKDLVLAGCVLHDIGKIFELQSDDEKIEYSTVGKHDRPYPDRPRHGA